jgi:hypothetical protein
MRDQVASLKGAFGGNKGDQPGAGAPEAPAMGIATLRKQ